MADVGGDSKVQRRDDESIMNMGLKFMKHFAVNVGP